MSVNPVKEKVKTLPRAPGVYFFKDSQDQIIYIGKAAVLRNRVRQYFQTNKDFDNKTIALVNDIANLDWIEVESEIDALFLESEMVKRYLPRYNILLRDDKSQLYIRINMKDEWPHISYTRNPADDGADYFGPYYNAPPVRQAMRYLRRAFPYYVKAPKAGVRPSLDAHIGLEPVGLTSSEYKNNLKQLISYIKGNRTAIIKEYENLMKIAAMDQDYEKAAFFRNRLFQLNQLKRRISFSDSEAISISKDRALRQIVQLFNLKKEPFRIEGYDISHMSGKDVVASQVVFTNGVSNRAEYRKYKMYSQRNDDYQNMKEVMTRRFTGRNKNAPPPNLILIDGGKGQLGAAATVLKDLNINIPLVSMAKNDELIMVHDELSNIDTSYLINLLKQPQKGVSVLREGDFLVLNLHVGKGGLGSHAKNLSAGQTDSQYQDVVQLFQRIRDESHRFAISYHTTLKRSGQTRNALEEIPGIGPKTRQKLLRQFGSVKGVAAASGEQISLVVGKAKAKLIKEQLK